ncbi:MAG: deoxynucleoside kinase [Bacteroidota bacterium]
MGAGKTTFSQLLAQKHNYRLILEQFTDNPFLPLFYQNPERYAFQVELFFMTERYKQLQAYYASQDLFQQNTVADYFFLKTLLFADSNLLAEEKRLFQQLFQTLNARFPNPDILIYLHRPIEELKFFIKKRGRTMENTIDSAYLEKVQKAYFNFFKTSSDFPILVVDLEGVDFVKTPAIFQKLEALLQQDWETKVHYLAVK